MHGNLKYSEEAKVVDGDIIYESMQVCNSAYHRNACNSSLLPHATHFKLEKYNITSLHKFVYPTVDCLFTPVIVELDIALYLPICSHRRHGYVYRILVTYKPSV